MADNWQIKQFSGAPECFLKPDAKDIYHSTKSQNVEHLEYPSLNQQTPASVYVVDLSVVTRTSPERLKGKELHLTFREWLLSIFNGVSNTASRLGANEIGMVADFYSNLSIKAFTRNTRGSSCQVNFRLDSKIPEDLVGAFTNGQFKSEINRAFTSTDIINS